jgi:hypothetical protein
MMEAVCTSDTISQMAIIYISTRGIFWPFKILANMPKL